MENITFKVNGIQVEADLKTTRKILGIVAWEAVQEQIQISRRALSEDQEYDGRPPHEHPHEGSSRSRTMRSSQKFWREEEDDRLFAYFPLSRENTPPLSKINQILDEFPGRSADAIQVHWYTRKKQLKNNEL